MLNILLDTQEIFDKNVLNREKILNQIPSQKIGLYEKFKQGKEDKTMVISYMSSVEPKSILAVFWVLS